MNNDQKFSALHTQDKLFQLGNVWDVQSALMFEKMGYQALGTSSAAIAASLGYEDGENMSFDELFAVVKSILEKVSLPLTVDIEAGYSREPTNIVKNIMRLSQVGVSGVNIEDSVVKAGKREILDQEDFNETVKVIKKALEERASDLFLNVRTDSFIMGLDNPLEETLSRITAYEASGADGIFVPAITDENDIKQIVECVAIPVNVMMMPNLPSFSKLHQLGIKRVSMGPFIYNKLNETFADILALINTEQSFNSVFTAK